MSNVGAGSALSINFSINNVPCLPAFSLPVSESKNFIILFKSDLFHGPEADVKFSFEYKDVVSQGKYKQVENLTLFIDKKDSTINVSQKPEELISEPEEI